MTSPRKKLWAGIALFWLLQAGAVYVLCAYLWSAATDVNGPNRMWGSPNWQDFTRTLSDGEYCAWALCSCAGAVVAQCLFLLPVRKPGAARSGRSLWISLTIAGLGVGTLGGAMMLAVWYTADLYLAVGGMRSSLIAPTIIVTALLGWCVATPLLIAFCRKGQREDVLTRLAGALFVGTIVEVAAIIPLDVLVRRRETCYCWAGTYIALLVAGGVGMVFLGPMILLPALSRRRKRWYSGHCELCGYDMSATPKADRCPECGTGWKPAT